MILPNHLVGTGIAIAEDSDDGQHNRVHDVVVKREHRATKKSKVNEPDSDAQEQHIEYDDYQGAPCFGACSSCHPRRPAAHEAGNQYEQPD